MSLFQKSKIVFAVFISVIFLSLGACSSTATTSSTTTTDDGTTTDSGSTNTVTLESNDDVIANTPSPDPSSMDYAVATANGSISALVKGSPAYQSAPGAEEVGCMTDTLYSAGVRVVRQLERMFLCKVRGIYTLAETSDLGVTVADNSTIYAELASMGGEDFGGGSQLIKVVHETGTGFGTIRAYQCSESDSGFSQIGFLEMSVDTDTNNRYTVDSVFRQEASEFSSEMCVRAQWTKNVGLELDDADFDGRTTLQFDDTSGAGKLILAADGATQANTLQGKHLADSTTSVALATWDADSGCASGQSGSNSSGEVPFALSTDSTGAKTYSSSSDTADCSNLPDEPDIDTCPEFSAITNGSWDCDVTGQTVIDLSISSSELEDAGGDRCTTLTDAFANEEGNPGECFGL